MNFKITALFLLIIVLLIAPASAITLKKQWEPSNKTVLILNANNSNLLVKAQFLHTEQDLTTFTETINLTSYVNYTFQASDLGISWQRFKGNNDIYKVETYRYVRTPYQIPIYDFGWNNWTESAFNNVTNQNDTIYHNESTMVPNGSETAYKLDRILFNPNGKYITAGTSYLIDVVAYREADTGETSIQTGFNFGGFTEYNATWWNTTWQFRYNNNLSNSTRPLVYKLNISNNTASFGNTTYLNITCYQPACTDLRFVKENSTTMPFWRYQNSSTNGTGYGVWYFNVTSNGTGFQIYSGASGVSDASDGNSTFSFFDSFDAGFDTTKWYPKLGTWSWENGYIKNICSSANCLLLSKAFNFTNGTLEADVNPDSIVGNEQAGIDGRNPNATTGGYSYFYYYPPGGPQKHLLQKLGVADLASDSNSWSQQTWHNNTRMIFNGGTISGDDSGTNQLSATDATYTIGQASFDSTWTTARGNFFDNVRLMNQTTMLPWASWGAQEIGVIHITSWSNNHTNSTDLTFTLDIFPKVINFNITTDFAPTNFTWFVNGSNQSVNFNNLTYNFTQVGLYTISVQTYNLTGDNYAFVNWTISVVPVTIVAQVPVQGCGERIFVNNTDLGPFGTGERIQNIKYYANISKTYVYIFGHNPNPADIDIDLYIDDTRVQDDDVRTTVSNNNRSKWFVIPRHASYLINISGVHHYEWREYLSDLDLSGCNFPEDKVTAPDVVLAYVMASGLLAGVFAIVVIRRKLRKLDHHNHEELEY